MSNITASSLSVSSTCAFSGTISLAQPLISGSTCSYQGITTTDLRTTGNVLFDTLPKSNVLPTLSSQLTTKSYVDTKNTSQDTRMVAIEGVNTTQTADILGVNTRLTTEITGLNTRITTNEATDVIQRTDINALSVRISPLENHLTNISYDSVTDTTNVMGTGMFILNAPLVGASSSESNALQTKGYIDAQDGSLNDSIVNLENRAGQIEAKALLNDSRNIIQNTDILILNQKVNQIGNNGTATSIGNQLTLLGGLRVGNLGTLLAGIQIGTAVLTVVGLNTVTFASAFTGTNFPKVFLSILALTTADIVVVKSRNLTGFTFLCNVSGANVDWVALNQA